MSFAKPEETESAGESYFESSAATEAPAEPEEAEAAQESADEIEPEAEEVKAEEVPADESEDIYSDSKIELSVVKADGEMMIYRNRNLKMKLTRTNQIKPTSPTTAITF